MGDSEKIKCRRQLHKGMINEQEDLWVSILDYVRKCKGFSCC